MTATIASPATALRPRTARDVHTYCRSCDKPFSETRRRTYVPVYAIDYNIAVVGPTLSLGRAIVCSECAMIAILRSISIDIVDEITRREWPSNARVTRPQWIAIAAAEARDVATAPACAACDVAIAGAEERHTCRDCGVILCAEDFDDDVHGCKDECGL